jgi:hypothetical protein
MTTVAFLSDIHFGSTDPAAWRLTLRLLKKIQPHVVFIGGDIIDMAPVSKYLKEPRVALGLQEELDIAFAELSGLRQLLPSAIFYYKAGNHEERLQKYLFSKAAELSPLRAMRLENLLRLDELDMSFIEGQEAFRIGELHFIHGHEVKCGSVYPARNVFLKLGVNVILGHWHKAGQYMDKTLDGKCRGAWVNSCLETFDPGYTFLNSWTHGFHVIEFTRSGRFKVEPFTFFQDKSRECFVYNGKLMSERTAVKSIREHKILAY